ncbi:hypothetical protein LCGC14_3026660, partial [marine sediment metagenome]
VNLKGGCCQICGYNKNYGALGFHHKNPCEKDIRWKKLRTMSEDKVLKELKKCILLCTNCHISVHNPRLNNPNNL